MLAQQELDDAVTWYDRQAESLGWDFLDEFDRAVRRIHSFPPTVLLDRSFLTS